MQCQPTTLDGRSKLLGVDGFEQIVDAVDAERFDSIVVVSGGNDYLAFDLDLRKDVETHAILQLDIHEDDVGVVVGCAEPFDSPLDRAANGNHRQVRKLLLDGTAQVGLCRKLVFDNQYVVLVHSRGSCTV